MSVGTTLGALYALLGLIGGALFALFAFIGGVASGNAEGALGAGIGGIFMAILLPVFYGIAGFIGGFLSAILYNLVAKFTGGISFDT